MSGNWPHITAAAAWFDEADVTLNGYIPGDEISREEAAVGVVSINAKISSGVIREVRVFDGPEFIYRTNPGTKEVSLEVPLKGRTPDRFIRVEAEGEDIHKIMVSTPFFVKG